MIPWICSLTLKIMDMDTALRTFLARHPEIRIAPYQERILSERRRRWLGKS